MQGGRTIKSIIDILLDNLKLLVPLLVGLALIVFFWGVARFIWGSGKEDEVEKGKKLMFWGVIAIFVMVAVWGLVAIVTGTFDLNNDPNVNIDSLVDYNKHVK